MFLLVQALSSVLCIAFLVAFDRYYVEVMWLRPRKDGDGALGLFLDDMPCYTVSVWPSRFAGISTCLQLLAILLDTKSRRTKSFRWKSRVWQDRYMTGVSSALLLITWTDFGLILCLHFKAKDAFRPSYGEQSFGFGQITASGLMFQAIFGSIAIVLRE